MTGWLRVGERAQVVAAQGQLAQHQPPEAAAAPAPLLGGYVQSTGDPAPPRPTAGGACRRRSACRHRTGPHQAYALSVVGQR